MTTDKLLYPSGIVKGNKIREKKSVQSILDKQIK